MADFKGTKRTEIVKVSTR